MISVVKARGRTGEEEVSLAQEPNFFFLSFFLSASCYRKSLVFFYFFLFFPEFVPDWAELLLLGSEGRKELICAMKQTKIFKKTMKRIHEQENLGIVKFERFFSSSSSEAEADGSCI